MDDRQHSWNQYALTAELAVRMKGRPFGRTALQKLTYLLQELHGVPVGYEFPLYTYGPYSSELSGDLDTLAAMQGVRVDPDDRLGGYLILPGARSESVRGMGAGFIHANDGAIDRLIAEFGGMTAKELELRATIVFADRDLRRRRMPGGQQALTNIVHELKPHFSRAQIIAVVHELQQRGHIAGEQSA